VLVALWHHLAGNDPRADCCALVAVGGYGRGELHPGSDIDLMILTSAADEKHFEESSRRFLHLLWDIGLDVGHSVRSVTECVSEGRTDLTVITTMMEARLLCGSAVLFEEMQAAIAPDQLWPADEYFHAKRIEQQARRKRYGDTAYNLEPNIKESPGGLRDLQMIGWVAKRHFNARSLQELVEHGFLTLREYRALIRCRNFLWRVRNGLHLTSGRREDRLLFEHQRTLAADFGYRDKPGSLAVEQLMKRYYRTVKELNLLNDILLQHFEEAFVDASETGRDRINRRFNAVNGYLEAVSDRVFQRQPFALLEVFMLLQQHEELRGIRASTIRLIQDSLPLVTREMRDDIACRSIFIELFRTGKGLTHALRKMNQYGVLGAYFPAFGRVVGQMQHDLFHIYTVDVHSLFVLRNLRRLTVDEFSDEFPLASTLMRKVFKPERLYLAGLMHDIAKGRGGDHSELGEGIAYRFCRLHELSEFDARFVAWLVRNHLIMSWTAQRQDISDLEVIDEFARKVGNQERLDNLYLLTMADIRGTSPKVWNEWKAKLLEQLYHATTRHLRRGFGSSQHDAERLADLRDNLTARVVPKPVAKAALERYMAMFDAEYFLRYDLDTLAWHIGAIHDVPAIRLPLVRARYVESAGGTEVLVFTPEFANLLVKTTGGFDLLNLNIVDARLHTTHAGYALHNYVVLDRDDKAICDRAGLKEIETFLTRQLLDPQRGRDPRKAHLPRSLKQFPLRTQVVFSPTRNGLQTLMEVVAQDRPGLLYQIAESLDECRVKLHNAKIATFGARVEDIFVLTDLAGNPLDQEATQRCLADGIRLRLDGQTDTPREVAF